MLRRCFCFRIKADHIQRDMVCQSVEKPEIQDNWISGFNCFIMKVAKHENAEEKLS